MLAFWWNKKIVGKRRGNREIAIKRRVPVTACVPVTAKRCFPPSDWRDICEQCFRARRNTWPLASVRRDDRVVDVDITVAVLWQREFSYDSWRTQRARIRHDDSVRRARASTHVKLFTWFPLPRATLKCRTKRRTFARKWQKPLGEYTRSAMPWWTRNWHSVRHLLGDPWEYYRSSGFRSYLTASCVIDCILIRQSVNTLTLWGKQRSFCSSKKHDL